MVFLKLLYNLYNFQIHPGALKQGGIPLVACCISAAERASVSGNDVIWSFLFYFPLFLIKKIIIWSEWTSNW